MVHDLISARCAPLQMPAEAAIRRALAIGIEHRGKTFALIGDAVGDVLTLGRAARIPLPPHCSPQLAKLTKGVFRTGELLLPVLDIDVLFEFPN